MAGAERLELPVVGLEPTGLPINQDPRIEVVTICDLLSQIVISRWQTGKDLNLRQLDPESSVLPTELPAFYYMVPLARFELANLLRERQVS